MIAFHFRTLHAAPGTTGRTSTAGAPSASATSVTTHGSRLRPWLHSPPFDDVRPGEPLDDTRFPVVLGG